MTLKRSKEKAPRVSMTVTSGHFFCTYATNRSVANTDETYQDAKNTVISISDYKIEFNNEKNVFYIISCEISICPVCGCIHLKVIGSRRRILIDTNGEKQTYIIRRMRCRDCKKIHHELPDCIVPYKRHSVNTFQAVIDDKTDDVPCEESTICKIKHWWLLVKDYFKGILAVLSAKQNIKFSTCPKLCEIVRAIVNSNFWIHTRSAFSSA
jgi:hypothetical protein